MTNKVRISEFNFIKAISAIGIVIFHYAIETGNLSLLPGNYSWGGVFVTVFFMVSGALLYYNYDEPQNIRVLYYKRWKSLLPSFYVAFLCLYIIQVIQNRNFFYSGHPATLLLTVIGQDGYLYDIIPNYYLLGEWFLGAILILYVLYPFLVKMINKSQMLTTVIISALCIISLAFNITYLSGFRSVLSCIFSFVLGIIIEKNKLYTHKWLIIPATICFIAVNYLITNNEVNLSSHIGGISLFFILFAIGHFVYYSKTIGKFSDYLSAISYDIFLIHHVMIMQLIKFIPRTNNVLSNAVFLIVSILLILIAATIFAKIMRLLKNSTVFLSIDKWILKKANQPNNIITIK